MFTLVVGILLAIVCGVAGFIVSPSQGDDNPALRRIGAFGLWGLSLIFLFGGIMLASVYFVDSKQIGIVDQKFGGSTLQDGRIIATDSENGIQAEILRDGLHWWKFAWQYNITQVPVVMVSQDQVGIIETRDGRQMPSERVYAREWSPSEVTNMLDATVFLTPAPNQKDDPATANVDEAALPRGFKGPQLTVLGPGEYAINTQLFQVTPVPMTTIPKGEVGVIKSNVAEIHSTLSGLYTPEYIAEAERAFARRHVEKARATVRRELELAAGIDIYAPKVQISETGEAVLTESDTSATSKPGAPVVTEADVDSALAARGITIETALVRPRNTVAPGQIGIWGIPLPPGKYWIHPKALEVTQVNVRKQQIDFIGKTTSGPEAETSAVYAKALDGFKFYVDNTILYHIEAMDAPGVVAEVGDPTQIRSIVISQDRKVLRDKIGEANTLQYVNDRVNQQKIATLALAESMAPYYVTIDDVNIRDMYEEQLNALLATQSDREIAKQQEVTYAQQQKAAEEQQKLNKAKQEAEEEKTLATAAYEAKREEERKKQAITKAEAQAEQVKIEAQAQAEKVRIEAEAQAAAITMKGEAEAKRYAQIVDALGPNNITAIELIERLREFKLGDLNLPGILVMGGDGGGGTDGAINARLLQLLTGDVTKTNPSPAPSEVPAGSGISTLPF